MPIGHNPKRSLGLQPLANLPEPRTSILTFQSSLCLPLIRETTNFKRTVRSRLPPIKQLASAGSRAPCEFGSLARANCGEPARKLRAAARKVRGDGAARLRDRIQQRARFCSQRSTKHWNLQRVALHPARKDAIRPALCAECLRWNANPAETSRRSRRRVARESIARWNRWRRRARDCRASAARPREARCGSMRSDSANPRSERAARTV